MIENIKLLLAFICDPNPIKKKSQNLYQIIAVKIVNLNGGYTEIREVCINKIASEGIIFGLDNVFNRVNGKKIYITMDNTYSTKIYFDNEQWDIHSDVPKLFKGENINNLDCAVVKFYFTNLIIGKFNFIIHYNFKKDYYIPIFEHYNISNGENIGILNDTKYKIQCIGYIGRNEHKYSLNEILKCLNIECSKECSYTLFGDSIALIEEVDGEKSCEAIILPPKCKVVYIYRFLKKLTLRELVLPPSIEHLSQEGNFSFASDGVKICISKKTNINNLFGNISYISNIDDLRQYTGIDIQEY